MKNVSLPQDISSMKEPINVKKQELGTNIKRLACKIRKNKYLDSICLFPVLKGEDISILKLPPTFPLCHHPIFVVIQKLF